jgi:DNA-binding Lrp family transcriptional regulator
MNAADWPLDETDRRLVLATQGGLPLVPRPFDAIADSVGIPPAEVRQRLQAMLDRGLIRRIGAVPNHYALGYTANGMSVWDVDDSKLDALGVKVGALPFVTHCYRRPRHLPLWPYNLFAMVHGRNRADVRTHLEEIAAVLGRACRTRDVLFSTRILKKTGVRIARDG